MYIINTNETPTLASGAVFCEELPGNWVYPGGGPFVPAGCVVLDESHLSAVRLACALARMEARDRLRASVQAVRVQLSTRGKIHGKTLATAYAVARDLSDAVALWGPAGWLDGVEAHDINRQINEARDCLDEMARFSGAAAALRKIGEPDLADEMIARGLAAARDTPEQ